MSYTYELSVDHNGYPDMTVWDRLQDGEAAGWKVTANERFVFYDPTETPGPQTDPMTGETVPGEIYYARVRYLPRSYDWSKFNLIAVREEEAT